MIIFVDMDGVLTDFVGAAYRACGADPWQCRALQAKIPCWDDVHVPLGISAEEMWSHIDARGESFWADMPWLADGMTIFAFAALNASEVRLCSTPSPSPHSAAGKLQWIHRHIPCLAKSYHLTTHKHELAGPGRMLIDDNPANCEAFIAHGGEARLVHHQYNAHANPELIRL